MRHVALVLLVAALPFNPVIAVGDHAPPASPVRTAKERLGEKGSDEQRVDDCKVPQQQRTRVRPTECHAQ
jgi:hypothetical protein